MGELVVIDVPGVFLGKTGERIVARKGKELIGETPLNDIETLLLEGRGITLSSDLIGACAERGIQINFTDSRGDPVATLAGAAFGATVATRRAQLSAYHDLRSVLVGRAIIAAKLRNQANLLKYFGKYRRANDPDAFRALARAATSLDGLSEASKLISATCIDDSRAQLMNIEGRGGAIYWAAVSPLIGNGFTTRKHRGATDPVNQAFNYGYGILYGAVQRAVLLSGLDPFGGFLHVDRPGKPSLVLDLIEEFRQPVVDRAIIAALGRGTALVQENGSLAAGTRRSIVDAVVRRLQTREPLRPRGDRLAISAILTRQARGLAAFLRGDGTYIPYVSRW